MTCFSSDQKETGLTHCRMVAFALISLSILIFLIYSNSFHCSWHFDDVPNITENPLLHMTKISWPSIKSAIFSDRNNPAMPYRPVACLSFALNYYFGGLHVAGYHLVNILIHLISSVFLFLFIYRTLTLPTLRKKYEPNAYFIALIAALLWAINPIQTQAITYIVQRMASFAAMFYIMAMYFYLKARTADTRAQKAPFFAICSVSFLLALSSKENAAMLPLSLLLYEMLILQEDLTHFLRKNLLKLMALLGLVLCCGLVYLYIKSGSPLSFLNGYENRPFTLGQRLLTEPRIILFYISLLFYPMPNRLNIAHDITVSTSLLHPFSTLLSVLIIAGSIAGALLLSRKRPFISFSILFFFLNHLIESSIFPLELIFEHRNYLPSMFLFVPVAMGFHYLLDTFATRKAMEFILFSFFILVLIGFGHSTFMRNFTWKNEKSLWIDAVDKSPNLFRPHHNLGKYYQDHGLKKEATSEYQLALKSPLSITKDEKFLTYYNMGKLYSDEKDYVTAKDFYSKSLALTSNFPDIYNNLAAIMALEGEYEQTVRLLRKSLSLNPFYAGAHYNIGVMLLKRRKSDQAIFHFRKANSSSKLRNIISDKLAIAYKQKGALSRAAVYFQDALRKRPNDIMMHLHLAEIFFRKGLTRRSQKEVKEALRLIQRGQIFDRFLTRLTDPNRSKNMMPSAYLTLKLLRQACKKQSLTLTNWENILSQTMQKLERRQDKS